MQSYLWQLFYKFDSYMCARLCICHIAFLGGRRLLGDVCERWDFSMIDRKFCGLS